MTVNTYPRPTLILFGTLLLGVLLGAVLTSNLAHYRDTQQAKLHQRGGFIQHMEGIIQPRDPAQRAAIRPYLDATARRKGDILRDAHRGQRLVLLQMSEDLAPLLDADQERRLNEMYIRPNTAPRRHPPPLPRHGPHPPPHHGTPPPGRR